MECCLAVLYYEMLDSRFDPLHLEKQHRFYLEGKINVIILQKRFSYNVLIAVAEILRKKEGRKREKIVKQKLLQLFFS